MRAQVVPAEEPQLRYVGVIRSDLTSTDAAPRQGEEGAPDAWLEVFPWAAEALCGVAEGDELLLLTWLHQARRDLLRVHPRGDPENPLTGVFATRSPHRPNPIGLHPVTVRRMDGPRLRVGAPIARAAPSPRRRAEPASSEAVDGTPVVDVKPQR